MASKLKKLHILALKLNDVGMRQTAGDIDYLISWLRSPEFNGGAHKKPDPAGENTIDIKSNNCPIPYTVSEQTVISCKSSFYARSYIYEAKEIVNDLKSIYTDSAETVALNGYILNFDKTMELLDEMEWQEWADIFPDFGRIDYEDLKWPGGHL